MPVQVKPMIAEAFIRLSKQKNIDKITVKDLVEACGISRQTFYYHFQDILEVIEWSLDQAFSHLLEQSLAADDPEAVLRGFLETSEESAELLQKLLHSQKREQVERLLVRSVRTYLKEVIERRGPVPGLSYENTCRDADRAEAASLYGEYAIDFAAQAVRHALLAALSAIDLQMSCDETNQSQSPNETEESV